MAAVNDHCHAFPEKLIPGFSFSSVDFIYGYDCETAENNSIISKESGV